MTYGVYDTYFEEPLDVDTFTCELCEEEFSEEELNYLEDKNVCESCLEHYNITYYEY